MSQCKVLTCVCGRSGQGRVSGTGDRLLAETTLTAGVDGPTRQGQHGGVTTETSTGLGVITTNLAIKHGRFLNILKLLEFKNFFFSVKTN